MRTLSGAAQRAIVACAGFCGVELCWTPDALACGQGGASLEQLLPLADAIDVPLNTALIVSSNGAQPEIRLVRLTNEAIGEPIPVAVTCRTNLRGEQVRGALCFGSAALEPQTKYMWVVQGSHLAEVSRRFTTGSTATTSSPLNDVSAQLLEGGFFTSDCGEYYYATIAFDTASLVRPVVATVGVPSYPGHAQLLSPGSGSVQLSFSGFEECTYVELIDELGGGTLLKEYCFGDPSPPRSEPEDGPVDPGTAGDEAEENRDTPLATVNGRGCSFTPQRPPPGLGFVVLVLGWALKRRATRSADSTMRSR